MIRNTRGNGTQVFGHTPRRLNFTDKRIRAGRESGLMAGVLVADEHDHQAGWAGLSEFIKSRTG